MLPLASRQRGHGQHASDPVPHSVNRQMSKDLRVSCLLCRRRLLKAMRRLASHMLLQVRSLGDHRAASHCCGWAGQRQCTLTCTTACQVAQHIQTHPWLGCGGWPAHPWWYVAQLPPPPPPPQCTQTSQRLENILADWLQSIGATMSGLEWESIRANIMHSCSPAPILSKGCFVMVAGLLLSECRSCGDPGV